MTLIQKTLLSFFAQVAKKESMQLADLKQEPCFEIDSRQWVFTLPNLHHFLQHQYDIFKDINYKQFRQLIYSCPVNTTAKSNGACIAIADNRSNVDQSKYALIWQETENVGT